MVTVNHTHTHNPSTERSTLSHWIAVCSQFVFNWSPNQLCHRCFSILLRFIGFFLIVLPDGLCVCAVAYLGLPFLIFSLSSVCVCICICVHILLSRVGFQLYFFFSKNAFLSSFARFALIAKSCRSLSISFCVNLVFKDGCSFFKFSLLFKNWTLFWHLIILDNLFLVWLKTYSNMLPFFSTYFKNIDGLRFV